MNANEVIATLASRELGYAVSPNDHVNMGQSSNDVIPTAIQVSAAINIEQQLLPALAHLSQTLADKQSELADVVKTGRTHLMDAMPVTFAQELGGWKSQIDHAAQGISHALSPSKPWRKAAQRSVQALMRIRALRVFLPITSVN